MLKSFANRKIVSGIFLAFAALLLFNAAAQVIILRQFSRFAAEKMQVEPDLSAPRLPLLAAMSDLRSSLDANEHAQNEYLAVRNRAMRPILERQWRGTLAAVVASEENWNALLSPESARAPDPEMGRAQSDLKNDLDRYASVSHQLMTSKASSINRSQRKGRAERGAKHPLLGEEKEAFAKSHQDLQNLAVLLMRSPKPAAGVLNLPIDSAYRQLRRQAAYAIALTSLLGLLLSLAIVRLVYPMQARLDSLAQSAAKSAQNISEISTHLANSSREQAQNAGVQQEQLGHIADSMLGAAEKVRAITGLALQAARLGGQAAECADQSQSNIDSIANQLRVANSACGQNSRQLAEMEDSIQQMQNLTVILQRLAQETQALARTTAAEAASAGEEAGEFGVAAWEIGKLAERGGTAVAELLLHTQRIQGLAKSADAAANEAISLSQAGLETVDRAADSLRTIRSALPELSGTIAHMANFAGEIVAEDRTATPLSLASELSRESAAWSQENSSAAARLSEIAMELQMAAHPPGASDSRPALATQDVAAENLDGSAQMNYSKDHPINHPMEQTETLRLTLHPGHASLISRSLEPETTTE